MDFHPLPFYFLYLANLASKLIFPISSKVVIRDPFDPAHRIDREVGDRGRRLMIGLSLESDFSVVVGSLIVVEGKGKYLRVVRSKTVSRILPELVTNVLNRIRNTAEPSLLDLTAVQEDIAVVQIETVESLKRDAGKYVDRLLIAAISDPGIWLAETTNDQKSYFPICEPNLLADATGVSVIDAFPIRDIASGGTGRGLDALPAWLLFADRNTKQAFKNCLFLSFGNDANAFFLPASDGLDVEIPEIRMANAPGLQTFEELSIDFCSKHKSFNTAIARLNVDGHFDQQLAIELSKANESRFTSTPKFHVESTANAVRTVVVQMVERLSDQIRQQINANAENSIHTIVVDSHPELVGTFVNQVQRVWKNSSVVGAPKNHVGEGGFNGVLTATLGAMSIDQMPANVPWITGANCQRILGRITPGSPTNWRQLLREMADFQPPAMRLRDAV